MIEVYDGIAYFDDGNGEELEIGDIDAVRLLIADLEARIEGGSLKKLCPACSGSGYHRGAIPRVYQANKEGRIIGGPYDPGCEACGGSLTRKGSGWAA